VPGGGKEEHWEPEGKRECCQKSFLNNLCAIRWQLFSFFSYSASQLPLLLLLLLLLTFVSKPIMVLKKSVRMDGIKNV